jgi:3-hydroxyisobutyrate dehydrogenase-like beta-hydroxyacid dehydrogenase
MTHIAFLGTGLLGAALAEAAAKRGEEIVAWNRTIEKAKALEQFGVRVAATPADAVRGAARVHLVLKDDAVVEDVVARLRPGLSAEAIVVDHTTTQPRLTAARAVRLNGEGVRYLHCPVFIGPAAARARQGTIMSSGHKELFDTVREPLERMAPRVEYLGEDPGRAAAFKLFGNTLIIGLAALAADVFAIGASLGIPASEALKVRDLVSISGVLTGRAANMAAGNYTPAFELAMARKDVRLMMESADGQPLAALPSIAARMDALIAEGYGDLDLAVLGIAATGGRAG